MIARHLHVEEGDLGTWSVMNGTVAVARNIESLHDAVTLASSPLLRRNLDECLRRLEWFAPQFVADMRAQMLRWVPYHEAEPAKEAA